MSQRVHRKDRRTIVRTTSISASVTGTGQSSVTVHVQKSCLGGLPGKGQGWPSNSSSCSDVDRAQRQGPCDPSSRLRRRTGQETDERKVETRPASRGYDMLYPDHAPRADEGGDFDFLCSPLMTLSRDPGCGSHTLSFNRPPTCRTSGRRASAGNRNRGSRPGRYRTASRRPLQR